MKTANKILCGLFVFFIFSFAICHLLMPDRDFSDVENRYLSSAPGITADNFFSGRFGSEFEVYLNDQFPFRDFFKKVSTAAQHFAGKRLIGGVYLAGGDTLIGRQEPINETLTERNIQSLNKLGDIDIPVYMALIPDASCIYADYLPYGAPAQDQHKIINEVYSALEVDCIDVYAALSLHSDEYIYYRTDHHWTSLGAYYGYEAIIGALSMDATPLGAYSPSLLTDSFYGTLYSKLPAYWIAPDSIYAYAPDMDSTVTVFDGTQRTRMSLYYTDNLKSWNKYTVFLGGNQPQIIIETIQTDAPRILVLRDSFFDSLTPFLQPHFSQIHLIDVRYYRQDLKTYIEENAIDIVLAAYSVDQFTNVMNLASVVG